ncbi:MAG: putative toxin-antitoxin system toxin component, PIN family [Rubrivivax sp.]|nr:putative toxin-antitoxin system toxin component, PIN family [Rubrivivax sp.]
MNTASRDACGNATPWLVADTQVVLDWLVFRDTAARPLLDAVLAGRLRWLASAAMRAELERMLRHPLLARWGHQVESALTFFDSQATLCPDPPAAPAPRLRCSDPDDQVFIDTALVHHAAWLVTRDRALLKLRRKALGHGLRIARPDEWRDTGHGTGAGRPA